MSMSDDTTHSDSFSIGIVHNADDEIMHEHRHTWHYLPTKEQVMKQATLIVEAFYQTVRQ